MNPKKKYFITLAIFFTTGLFLIIFGIKPLFQEIRKLSEEFLLIKKELVQLSEKEKEIEGVKNVLTKHEKDFEKMENLFVDSKEPMGFITFLEEQALQSKVQLRISSLGPEKEKTPWSSLSFQMEMASPFKNFLKFLEKLESAPYLIQINNFNLRRLKEGDVKQEELKNFSVGDIQGFILIRLFTR